MSVSKKKATNNVLEDEMYLAKLIATTKARGMRAIRGHMFTTAYGLYLGLREAKRGEAAFCCASGAARLAGLPYVDGLISGNDNYGFVEGPGFLIGQAFYDACKAL